MIIFVYLELIKLYFQIFLFFQKWSLKEEDCQGLLWLSNDGDSCPFYQRDLTPDICVQFMSE